MWLTHSRIKACQASPKLWEFSSISRKLEKICPALISCNTISVFADCWPEEVSLHDLLFGPLIRTWQAVDYFFSKVEIGWNSQRVIILIWDLELLCPRNDKVGFKKIRQVKDLELYLIKVKFNRDRIIYFYQSWLSYWQAGRKNVRNMEYTSILRPSCFVTYL